MKGTQVSMVNAEEYCWGAERVNIMSTLAAQDEPLRPGEVAQALGQSTVNISKTMQRMRNKGLLKSPAYGKYELAPGVEVPAQPVAGTSVQLDYYRDIGYILDRVETVGTSPGRVEPMRPEEGFEASIRVDELLHEIESGEFDVDTMDWMSTASFFGDLIQTVESDDNEFIWSVDRQRVVDQTNKEYVCRLILKWWNESIGYMRVEDGELVVAPRDCITPLLRGFIGAHSEIFKAIILLDRAVHDPPLRPDGYVYVLGAGPYYKIGRATEVDRRVKQLKVQLPFEVEVIHVIECENHEESEKYWHTRFGEYRSNGEWFELESAHLMEIKGCHSMRGEEKL